MLGFAIVCLKGMRIRMFQLSGFYYMCAAKDNRKGPELRVSPLSILLIPMKLRIRISTQWMTAPRQEVWAVI